MGMDITEICGEKTAGAISDIYGHEAEKVIEDLDIIRLLQVPGLGRKKAISIINKSYSQKYGNDFEKILGGNASKVYDKIVDLLRSYIATEDAKDIILSYFPVRERETIESRMSFLDKARKSYEAIRDSYPVIQEQFKRIDKLKDVPKRKYYDYVVITDSSEAEKTIKNPLCDSLYISTPADAEYAHNSYSFMVYVYGSDSELSEAIEGYADVMVECDGFDHEAYIPDAIVERFIANESTLDAIYKIKTILGGAPKYLEELLSLLKEYRERDLFKEKKITPEEFVDLVRSKEREINKRIGKTLTESGVGLKADRLLELFSSIGSSEDPTEALKQNLPPEFNEVYQSILKETLEEIEGVSGMDASSLFPDTFSYPISIDTEKLYELRNVLESSDFRSQYALKRKISSFSKRFIDIHGELLGIYEMDFMLGMGRFLSENDCSIPMLSGKGTSVIDAISMLIDSPLPVSYKIGNTSHDIAGNDNVSVLTGANSGGKTTLLETLLSAQLLVQMGIPAPASEMDTTIYDSIRYLAKAKSQNAGAFETTIKSLVPLATEKGKSLILIDELESITEPGSAARIIAALIEILKENDETCCIIVTHLGEEISELCDVRVDGIEASGLDEDLNLVVERQPKFGRIGKSTPELIVEKLYRKSKGEKKKVYERMLEKLKE